MLIGAILAGPLPADSGLPEFTIGPPAGDAPAFAFDLMFVLSRRIEQQAGVLFDPPSPMPKQPP